MIDQIIQAVQQDMMGVLSETQMRQLLDSLNRHLAVIGCVETGDVLERSSDMLSLFIAAKRVEGCSEKSLRYYESTIRNMLEAIDKASRQITTEDLRSYLDTYQRRGTVSKVTLDNVRRILSVERQDI